MKIHVYLTPSVDYTVITSHSQLAARLPEQSVLFVFVSHQQESKGYTEQHDLISQ